MGIPESALETWSRQGETAAAEATAEWIRSALPHEPGFPLDLIPIGSYANGTNVASPGAVDVVVRLLPPATRSHPAADPAHRPDAMAFRALLADALRDRFGRHAVSEGDKVIRVEATPERPAAHVLPGIPYRRIESGGSVEGITFRARATERWLLSFPGIHRARLVEKDAATRGTFRRLVRAVKNARDLLAAQQRIPWDLAPSYYIESMLGAVPDDLFGDGLQDAFVSALGWLRKADLARLQTLDGQTPLHGEWPAASARRFLDAVVRMWIEWPEPAAGPIRLEPESLEGERRGLLGRFRRR